MFLERRLHSRHKRAFDSRLHIAPMFLILRVTGPVLRKTDRARERNFSIDDKNAAMRTAIGAIDAPGMRRMIIGELAARRFHHAHVGVAQVPAGTDAIEQNAHFDSGFCALDQRIAKLPPNLVRVNDVGFEVDRFSRG